MFVRVLPRWFDGKSHFSHFIYSPFNNFLSGGFRICARIGDILVTGHATSWPGNSFRGDYGVSLVSSGTGSADAGGSFEG